MISVRAEQHAINLAIWKSEKYDKKKWIRVLRFVLSHEKNSEHEEIIPRSNDMYKHNEFELIIINN